MESWGVKKIDKASGEMAAGRLQRVGWGQLESNLQAQRLKRVKVYILYPYCDNYKFSLSSALHIHDSLHILQFPIVYFI